MSDFAFFEDEAAPTGFNLAPWRRLLGFVRLQARPLGGLCLAGLLMAIADAWLPLVTAQIIDDAIATGGSWLGKGLALYLGLVLAIAAFVWIFITFAGYAATGIAYAIRKAAFAHLQSLSFSFYDRRPMGWMMARLTSDCARLANVIPWFLLDLVWGSCFILGIACMMLWLHFQLGLLVLVVIPPLAVISRVFQKKLLESQRRVRKTNSLMTAAFNESIMGVRTTKALVREDENLDEFQQLSSTMHSWSSRNLIQAALYLPIVLTIGSAGAGIALWQGGVRLETGMSFGTLIAFMQWAGMLWIPVFEMAERFTQFQAAQASAERLTQLLETEPEVVDDAAVLASVADLTAEDLTATIQEIVFDQVTFSYNRTEVILEDFNLTVEAGQSIALVGETGSGKSTIVNLLSRFYEPTEGKIWINRRDYRHWGLPWLQSRLGIVLQTPHLFSGTIRENIRYGRLEATDAEVQEAARKARAHPFICLLPDGYETEVGESGGLLSVGERQLVALARAVLADPQIFILDEATSSVDTETERRIQEGIEQLLEGRISFIIAHRLSTIRSADRILVIDKGKILEEGSHESLLARGGRYAKLYKNQFARESLEKPQER